MISILGFLIILGPLVVVHELGHFLFAKLFNVKAEAFSVGFGPRIWSKKYGETEFRLSAIPLGGYVKLLGEDPQSPLSDAEKARALHNQEPWKRFFIFFGGPLFNFIFAILVFMAILAIGEPQIASVVGRVTKNSEAEKMGFESGDKILSINAVPMERFVDVITYLNEHPKESLKFQIERRGETVPREILATPSVEDGFSMYGEQKEVGKIDGLIPFPRQPVIGVSNPKSLAAQSGLVTGDILEEFGGKPVATWEEVEQAYLAEAQGAPVPLSFKTSKGEVKKVVLQKPRNSSKTVGSPLAQDWGLHSSELFVDRPMPDSPAEKAGLKSGDRVVRIDNVVLDSFYDLKDTIQKSAKEDGKVTIVWERDGNVQEAELEPKAAHERDPVLKKITHYTVGLIPMLALGEPATIIERVWNPFVLAYRATERMLTYTWRNVVAIAKMISGKVSVSTLGGPILIGKIAGDSLERGLIAFLNTMALLSVGLGILNVMPIPVLDGGHLLLLGIEAIRGKPLSVRQMEVIQQVGLSLILLLMVVVIRNDLARILPIFN